MFTKGQRIGKYEILKALGSGGFGSVYLALDTLIEKKVAIKVPHEQSQSMDILLREPKILAGLEHPNIVKVFTAEKIDGVFFIVMEYVEGRNLHEVLRDEKFFDVTKAADYLEKICSAVEYAHEKNIIHRDLRPANVMVTEKNNGLKVADFGTSKIMENIPFAKTKIGSPPHMAPEQYDGKAVFASDVYSIGVMAYRMVAGKLPYYDINPSRIEHLVRQGRAVAPNLIQTTIPKKVSEVVMKAIENQVSKRYQRASEFIRDFNKALDRTVHSSEIENIRERLEARKTAESLKCWNCGRTLPPRAKLCNYCNEKQ